MKPVIIGESNPFGGDEHFALYDEPESCTGDRLCRMVMGLRSETYRASFERRNLLRGSKWSAPRAREAAAKLCSDLPGQRVWILLGKKVAAAFFSSQKIDAPCLFVPGNGVAFKNTAVLLPHPSGLNRMWADRTLSVHCRQLLVQVLPEIPFGELFIHNALRSQ